MSLPYTTNNVATPNPFSIPAAARVLSIDFETASRVDLRRSGVAVYAEDTSTRVLCMAWAFDAEPVQVWRIGTPFPQEVMDHVHGSRCCGHVAAGGVVHGWNVGFEWAIWNKTLARQLRLTHPGPGKASQKLPALGREQVRDTMARAAYFGLPLSLDMAGAALNLPIQKDKAGHALMMRMCKPRQVLADGTATWWHETDPTKLDELCAYCARDVEVERLIGAHVPQLPAREQAIWQLDHRINTRGVGVDTNLVICLQDFARLAAAEVNTEVSRLTWGVVPTVTSTAKLLAFLKSIGYPHDDLRKDTVAARLDDPDCGELEQELLQLRADGAKTSAAKLQAMLDASGDVKAGVGTVRGMLQYYGAFRTGRWAGRLIQLQNMPRGELKPDAVQSAIQCVLQGVTPAMMAPLFGAALRVVSSLLRSCIVARPGNALVVVDFAQIEARVIAWLAGQDDLLSVFARDEDVYCYTASRVTGQVVTKGHPLRQFGKVLVLACGFGMGGPKFQATAATYGLTLTDAEAADAVQGWRNANPKIVSFWWELDAAVRTVLGGGAANVDVPGGKIRVGMWGDTLVLRLPSGRGLFYRDARLVPSMTRPGQAEISYMGLNQYTRKWERLRTYGGKLAENVTQAVARDLMAEAMLACEEEFTNRNPPARLILTVHDELIAEAEAPYEGATLTTMCRAMQTPPPWAFGLPLGAEGWFGARYKK